MSKVPYHLYGIDIIIIAFLVPVKDCFQNNGHVTVVWLILNYDWQIKNSWSELWQIGSSTSECTSEVSECRSIIGRTLYVTFGVAVWRYEGSGWSLQTSQKLQSYNLWSEVDDRNSLCRLKPVVTSPSRIFVNPRDPPQDLACLFCPDFLLFKRSHPNHPLYVVVRPCVNRCAPLGVDNGFVSSRSATYVYLEKSKTRSTLCIVCV